MPEQTFYMYIDYMNYIQRSSTEEGRKINDGYDRVDSQKFGNVQVHVQKQFNRLKGKLIH
jgi:hypothetical protein